MTNAVPLVLIVDDDSATRHLLRAWLADWKFHVVEASNATEALQRMVPQPADIVLCDIRMANRDGFWLLEQIRQGWPQTAVIMVTALDDQEIVNTAQIAGAVGFVTKPIEHQILKRSLVHAMQHIAAARNTAC